MTVRKLNTISVQLKDFIDIDDLTLNEIMLLVGKNGTGKTFVNKVVFALSNIAVMAQSHGVSDIKPLAKHVIEGTFDNVDFTGTLSLTYDNGAKIIVGFNEGEIINAYMLDVQKGDQFPPAVYMSTGMRLFSNMDHYLKLRTRLLKDEKFLNEEAIKELLEDYRLYDILAVEKLIMSCPIDLNQDYLNGFEDMVWPLTLDVSDDKKKFVLNYPDGSQKQASVLGNGEQSVINMCATLSIR